MEQAVVLAIEEAIRGVDGIKKVRSTAREGYATVSAELVLGTKQDRALNDVKSAVDRITSFPADVERPTVSILAPRQQAISIVLYGDVDEAALRAVAEDSRRELLRDDRITYVELTGIRPLEISVEVPQAQLRKHDLTLDEIGSTNPGSIGRAARRRRKNHRRGGASSNHREARSWRRVRKHPPVEPPGRVSGES